MASQDARLTKFKADFKQQQSEMTNKIDTVLKAITDRIAGALPSDTVKNPKLSTSPVLSTHSYPTKDPQCSTYVHGEGDLEGTNTIVYIEEQRDTPLLEQKDIIVVGNLGSNKDNKGIEWLDVEEPLDLVNTSEESVYESLIKEMPKCSLNYDFRIKKGDPRNLKIPCMIGHKFNANAYIDVDLPMNIMSLAYYNSIRKNGYEYRGRSGGLWWGDPEMGELSSKGHDLLSSKVILSEDDYDRRCKKPSDLEDGFYKECLELV
ncbi:hypothetical protein Tco_0669001 [Tanacetum coccineum]